MPRKATAADPNVPLAIKRIEDFCKEKNICVFTLAKTAGVSQPSLCRFLKCERKSVTKTAQKVLKHIENWHKTHNSHSQVIMQPSGANDAGRELIESAIMSLWDGEFRSAQILAPLIRALKPTLEIAFSITSDSTRGGNT